MYYVLLAIAYLAISIITTVVIGAVMNSNEPEGDFTFGLMWPLTIPVSIIWVVFYEIFKFTKRATLYVRSFREDR